MNFFKRVAVFFKLKNWELCNNFDWEVIRFISIVFCIVYGMSYATFIGSYLVEKNFNWTWQYSIIELIQDKDDEPIKLLADPGVATLSLPLTIASYIIFIPLMGGLILFISAIFLIGIPCAIILIVFMLLKFIGWLYRNWVQAGDIVKGKDKEPWLK